MAKLTPYLLFEGNCAEAMAFYHSCLGGELSLTKVADSPAKDRLPGPLQDRIVNSRLVGDQIDITASDWLHPTRTPARGNMVCLYLSGGTWDDTQPIFDKLARGSDPSLLDPLQKTFFGFYGALTDKFGVRWMFQGQ